MEELWDLQEKADIVFSIYGLGWTVNLKKTLNNIKKYLKPEGQLIFSWEHPYYSRFTFKNHNLVLTNPYFSEKQRYLANWNGSEGAYIKDRKISSWINYLTNAGFVLENLYEPRPITFPKRSKDPQRYYSKFKSQLTPTSIVFCCKLKP
jgi:SAM-dependent methyltransferase